MIVENYHDLLKQYYKKYLHREPDPSGFKHYCILLEKGDLDENTLRNEFLNSAEYKIKNLEIQYEKESKIKIQKNDKIFFVNSNNRNFWAQVQTGIWEPNTFRIFDEFLDLEHSYIDIGSWIGSTVLYGCQKAKFCYGIEPDPVSFKNLKNNIELNSNLYSKINVSNNCISNKNGTVFLTPKNDEGGDSMSSTVFKKSSKSWEIPSITLEQFILNNSIIDYNFIKIDIEGSEFSVLPSASKFLFDKLPTLHLSLHSPLMENPKKEMEKILQVINEYDYVYDDQLNHIEKESILDENNLKTFFDIVISQKQIKK